MKGAAAVKTTARCSSMIVCVGHVWFRYPSACFCVSAGDCCGLWRGGYFLLARNIQWKIRARKGVTERWSRGFRPSISARMILFKEAAARADEVKFAGDYPEGSRRRSIYALEKTMVEHIQHWGPDNKSHLGEHLWQHINASTKHLGVCLFFFNCPDIRFESLPMNGNGADPIFRRLSIERNHPANKNMIEPTYRNRRLQ